MKTSKMAKILSMILALAMIVCCLPFALGVTASAEGTTIDYSAMENLLKPAIADYTDTFGMHDGVGLRVKDGALIPDGDWFWQLDKIDKYVDATPAYAIYDVAPNTEFVAKFSATTDTSVMKYYVSENMVDWYLAGSSGDENTVTVNVPYYANYLKIAWPLGANVKNGLLSVNFVKPEADANNIVINYKKATDGTNTMVGSGLNDVNVLNNRGVWQSAGMSLNANGVIVANWSSLENATSPGSYNGYATYKVQPNTRFSMTVTTTKENSEKTGWTAKFNFDTNIVNLGYENPAEYNIEIYVSPDNVNFTKLEDNIRTFTARYPNNPYEGCADATRSTEYNFIVPEGMAYVKCKMPMTQSLKTVTGVDGNIVSTGSCGNDILSINKVEFTRANYDYREAATGDYYLGTTIDAASFGLSAYSGISVSAASGIDVAWKESGTYTAYAQYDIVKGTPFYAGIRIHWASGLAAYVEEKGSYAIKLQGYNVSTAAWDDIDVLNFDSTYSSSVADFALNMSSEESIYDKVRVYWNHGVGSSANGNNLACISEVVFTPRTYDFTKCTDITTLTTDYGAYSYTSSGNPVKTSTAGLRLGWSELASKSEEGGLPKAYVVYKAVSGASFKVNFYKNNWYNQTYISERWNDPDYTIRVYSSATDTFETKTEHEITYSAPSADNKGINNTIEFDVPTGENYIKIEFPQEGRVSDNKDSKGNFTHVGNDFLDIKSVEISNSDLVLDGISIDSTPTNLSFYKGDAFNTDGFVVGLDYSNGEYRRIDSGFTVAEADTSVLGEQVVNFGYGDYAGSYTINIYVNDGDLNCDKKVNMLDLIRLKKIATNVGSSDGADADIDGSGAVDGSDLTKMRQFLLGAIKAL